ncbi:MAG: hypothetical protein IIZ71_06655 [Caulobacter sp.]|uniref:Uncharacterized protein n=2 Tax=Caulobacter TaxID=75 RepID=R0EDV7_CAUVI|nr:hypothetical protein [Caulobacter vibrioides]ENZ80229.1 hypothetical protein OR37_03863 [Caulobacter vibrioides OR37]MBQ1560601.1 hypothetical protein [Caulobacter sp.]
MASSVMRSGDRRRRATILAGSLLLHGALLAWLALPVPPLVERMAAEDLSTVTIDLIRPRPKDVEARPARAATAPSSPLPQFQARPPARPVPAGVPTLSVPASGLAKPGSATHPAPLPAEAGGGDLRSALRSSTGCVSADAVGLNRRERERCDERFGAAKAKGEPLQAMDAAKRQGFDAQAAAQEAYRRYKEGSMGPGVDHRSREGPGTMKEIPFVLGAQQDGLGRERRDVVDQIRREHDADDRARKFLELQKKAGQRP